MVTGTGMRFAILQLSTGKKCFESRGAAEVNDHAKDPYRG